MVGVAGRAREHIQTLDSSGTCKRVNPPKGIPLAPVFVGKDCTFGGLTRRWGWQRILFLVRQNRSDGRERMTCGPAYPGEGKKNLVLAVRRTDRGVMGTGRSVPRVPVLRAVGRAVASGRAAWGTERSCTTRHAASVHRVLGRPAAARAWACRLVRVLGRITRRRGRGELFTGRD